MGKQSAYITKSQQVAGRLACPRCGQHLVRVERRLLDRLISLVVPVQRYRCRMHNCQWEGTVRTNANGPTQRSAR